MRETVILCDICKKPAREFIFRGVRSCAEDNGCKEIDLCDAHAVEFLQDAMKRLDRSGLETIFDSFLRYHKLHDGLFPTFFGKDLRGSDDA